MSIVPISKNGRRKKRCGVSLWHFSIGAIGCQGNCSKSKTRSTFSSTFLRFYIIASPLCLNMTCLQTATFTSLSLLRYPLHLLFGEGLKNNTGMSQTSASGYLKLQKLSASDSKAGVRSSIPASPQTNVWREKSQV